MGVWVCRGGVGVEKKGGEGGEGGIKWCGENRGRDGGEMVGVWFMEWGKERRVWFYNEVDWFL